MTMTWHGQINRSLWELETTLKERPNDQKLKRELLRTHFLQRFEYDRGLHIPRDDRTFLFLQDDKAPACLLLHGANGTPAEMRDLGNYLYGKGFTVYCPRLSRFDLKNRPASWESWVTAAENAYTTVTQYNPKTMIVGFSLGATVAMILQRLHPVSAMVLLAPALYPKLGLMGRIRFFSRHITPSLFFKFAGWNGEVVKAMEYVRKTESGIDVPVLTLQAKDDHLVSGRGLKSMKKWAKNRRSNTTMLPEGGHVITRGPAQQKVYDRIMSFVRVAGLVRGGRDGGSSGRDGGSGRGGGRQGERGVEERGGRGERGGRSRRGGRGRGGRNRRGGRSRRPSDKPADTPGDKPAGRPGGDRPSRRSES